MSGVDWATAAPPSTGLCARCRKREADTTLRLSAQERPKGKNAGKTLAGRAIKLCQACARDVFVYTLNEMEVAAAALGHPDHPARAALRYVVAYLEADLNGRELCDSIDLEYLRGVCEALAGEREAA